MFSWLAPVSDAAAADRAMIANVARHACNRDQKYIVFFFGPQKRAEICGVMEGSIDNAVDVQSQVSKSTQPKYVNSNIVTA